MPPVGDERRGAAAQADRPGKADAGDGAFDMAPRRRKAERNDFDRQRKRPEHWDQLGRIGDHRHPLRGRGDDLLAQERAAAALDQPELRIDLVRPVDRQIELGDVIQRRERNAEAPCLLLGRPGRPDAHDLKTALDRSPTRSTNWRAVVPLPRPSFIPGLTSSSARRAASRFRRSLSAAAVMTSLILVCPRLPPARTRARNPRANISGMASHATGSRGERGLNVALPGDASEGKRLALALGREPTFARRRARPRTYASRSSAR